MNGYSHGSQPIRLERDCPAVMVPSGDLVQLPAGEVGYLTQALGGSFTVFIDGNLFRIRNQDADAIGQEPLPLPELAEGADAEQIEKAVWAQLRTCFDPEIPINIVDLGLVYGCEIKPAADGRCTVEVAMTLTAPGCGMGEILLADVREKLEALSAVAAAEVELVFDPPWNRTMMSEAAQLETGML